MWGRIRVRSCNRQQLISLGMELARRLEAWRPRIADRRPPALRGVFLFRVGGEDSAGVEHIGREERIFLEKIVSCRIFCLTMCENGLG